MAVTKYIPIDVNTQDFYSLTSGLISLECQYSPKTSIINFLPFTLTNATIQHYKQYGFNTLILWTKEFKNQTQILQKIKEFNKNGFK